MIQSLDDLSKLATDDVVVLVKRDARLRMVSIVVAGHHFMSGNSWDFRPECHGGFHYDLASLHGTWMSSTGLVASITAFLEAEGATKVTVVEETFDWEGMPGSQKPQSADTHLPIY